MSVFLSAILMLLQSNDQAIDHLSATMDGHTVAMNGAFKCMDKKTKYVLQENLMQSDPVVIVDKALDLCADNFASMKAVLQANELLKDSAENLTIENKSNIRDVYLEKIVELFRKPDFADSRSEAASGYVSICVKANVEKWATQNAEPDVLAIAAVNACETDWKNWRAILELKKEAFGWKFPIADLESKVRENLVEKATVWVFEARVR